MAPGLLKTEFRFAADVTGASCYELDFGDRVVVECELGDELICTDVDGVECAIQGDNDHEVVCGHYYKRLDNYRAKLKAWRGTSGPIPLNLNVSVKRPRPVAEPTPSYVSFSAKPSDPETHGNIEFPEADFTFTAYVDDAESYELDFGDGDANVQRNIEPKFIEPRSKGNGIRHVYKQPGSYKVIVRAWSNTGDKLENELRVAVPDPPQPPNVFKVEPSDPNSPFGVGSTDTEFIFTADVRDAVLYQLFVALIVRTSRKVKRVRLNPA